MGFGCENIILGRCPGYGKAACEITQDAPYDKGRIIDCNSYIQAVIETIKETSRLTKKIEEINA
jgi:hypothetical protein